MEGLALEGGEPLVTGAVSSPHRAELGQTNLQPLLLQSSGEQCELRTKRVICIPFIAIHDDLTEKLFLCPDLL